MPFQHTTHEVHHYNLSTAWVATCCMLAACLGKVTITLECLQHNPLSRALKQRTREQHVRLPSRVQTTQASQVEPGRIYCSTLQKKRMPSQVQSQICIHWGFLYKRANMHCQQPLCCGEPYSKLLQHLVSPHQHKYVLLPECMVQPSG